MAFLSSTVGVFWPLNLVTIGVTAGADIALPF